jgi:hypothetical protein
MIQFILWPDWHGIRFFRWTMERNGHISRLITHSVFLGFLEIRRMRKTWKPRQDKESPR